MTGLAELLLAGKKIVAKEVVVAGVKATVHFRRITGGEKIEILRGQKLSRGPAGAGVELDVALNEEQKQKVVLFSVVNQDGAQAFKDLKAVKDVDNPTLIALYEAAMSNEEPEAAKKA